MINASFGRNLRSQALDVSKISFARGRKSGNVYILPNNLLIAELIKQPLPHKVKPLGRKSIYPISK